MDIVRPRIQYVLVMDDDVSIGPYADIVIDLMAASIGFYKILRLYRIDTQDYNKVLLLSN